MGAMKGLFFFLIMGFRDYYCCIANEGVTYELGKQLFSLSCRIYLSGQSRIVPLNVHGRLEQRY